MKKKIILVFSTVLTAFLTNIVRTRLRDTKYFSEYIDPRVVLVATEDLEDGVIPPRFAWFDQLDEIWCDHNLKTQQIVSQACQENHKYAFRIDTETRLGDPYEILLTRLRKTYGCRSILVVEKAKVIAKLKKNSNYWLRKPAIYLHPISSQESNSSSYLAS